MIYLKLFEQDWWDDPFKEESVSKSRKDIHTVRDYFNLVSNFNYFFNPDLKVVDENEIIYYPGDRREHDSLTFYIFYEGKGLLTFDIHENYDLPHEEQDGKISMYCWENYPHEVELYECNIHELKEKIREIVNVDFNVEPRDIPHDNDNKELSDFLIKMKNFYNEHKFPVE